MGKNKCHMVFGDARNHSRCKNPVYLQLKVQVVHVKSGIRRWQQWPLCKECFFQFIARKGQGYRSLKIKTMETVAFVIDYQSEGF